MSLSTGELLFVVFISIVLAISVICNIMVLVVLLRTPKMINATNIFICNLTVSDILLAGVVIPQNIHDISHAEINYYEGDFLCRIVNFCPLLCIMASIYSMVAISFERRRAILVSAEHRTTIRQAVTVIPIIWFLAFAFCVPSIYEYSEYVEVLDNETTIIRCGSNGVSYIYSVLNGVFIFLLAYVVPLLLLLINYGSIFLFFRKRGMFGGQAPGTNVTAQALSKARVKLIKMLILVAMLFALSWMPYFALFLLEKITGQSDVSESNGAIALLRVALAIFSTAYNFLLYVVYNRNFRNGFKALFNCQKLKMFKLTTNTVAPTSETGNARNQADGTQQSLFILSLQAREPTA